MRSTPQRRPARGVVCRVAASWCRVAASGDVAGLPEGWGHARHRRRPVRWQGQRAGRQRPRPA
jgi:hypothetical protein